VPLPDRKLGGKRRAGAASARVDAWMHADRRQEQICTYSAVRELRLVKNGRRRNRDPAFDHVLALGASAAAYYPDIARLLGAELIVPPFSEVAGAVGAAAGSVRQRVMILVTQPKDGVFRIHLPDGLQDKGDLQEALALARTAATEMATRRATAAGAGQIETSLSEAIDEIDLGADKSLFLQAAITADATGTPA